MINSNSKRTDKGFTLIELSVVLIIFGFLAGTAFLGLNAYTSKKIADKTEDALSVSQSAFLEFFSRNGRYPCPANPELGPSDLEYGKQNCNLLIVDARRDNTTIVDIAPTVMIGAIPFRTMLDPNDDGTYIKGVKNVPLRENVTIDGWGNKLKYAVSGNLINSNNYEDNGGVIEVVDENDQSILGAEHSAHFVLVSMGENSKGAYSSEGELRNNCVLTIIIDNNAPPPPPSPVSINEIENCHDTDGVFLKGLRNDQHNYRNDDKLVIGKASNASYWRVTGQHLGKLQIANINLGNVGIGVDEPKQRLDILGDLKADNIRADAFCEEITFSGNDGICMSANVVTGHIDMKCSGSGKGVTAIEGNNITDHCKDVLPVNVPFPPTTWKIECEAGDGVYGISNITGVLCRPINN